MTTAPESPERDAALDAAWRAHSRDEPPAHLDTAILAAAHRAVGAGPRDARTAAAEATSPQRWWMPLAAAATIGAIAIGVLQLAPRDTSPTEPTVSDMSARDAAPRAKLAAPERKEAAATASAPEPSAAPEQSAAAAGHAAPAPPAPEAPALKNKAQLAAAATDSLATTKRALEPAAPSAPPPPAAAMQVPSGAPAAAIPAPSVAQNAIAPRKPGNIAESDAQFQKQVSPQPFPAEADRRTRESVPAASDRSAAQMSRDKRETEAAAPASRPVPPLAAAPPSASAPAMAASAPQEERGTAAALGKMTASKDAASGLARSDQPAAPAAAFAPTPPQQNRASASPASGGAPVLAAKVAANSNAMDAKAPDTDAWIARIHKLFDEGKLPEAAKELLALRAAVPDADARLPPDMRAWAATVKP